MDGNLFYSVMDQDGLGLQETRVGVGRVCAVSGFLSAPTVAGELGAGAGSLLRWAVARLNCVALLVWHPAPTEPSVGKALWEDHHTGEEGQEEERGAGAREDVLVSCLFPQAAASLELLPLSACIEGEEHCC